MLTLHKRLKVKGHERAGWSCYDVVYAGHLHIPVTTLWLPDSVSGFLLQDIINDTVAEDQLEERDV